MWLASRASRLISSQFSNSIENRVCLKELEQINVRSGRQPIYPILSAALCVSSLPTNMSNYGRRYESDIVRFH